MKVKVIGGGFIASHLPYEHIKGHIWHADDACETILGDEPDVLINCIGRCGNPNVDQCELIKEETNFANTTLPIMLANLCNENGIRFVQIGSGCIFSGESPNTYVDWGLWQRGNWTPPTRSDYGFKETDFANPQSYYAKTKYAADLAIGDLPNTTILRVRMPISHQHSPRNFIDKVANYKRVIDIPNSMTFVDDLVRCIDWIIQNDKRGIWNVVNPEPLSAADVMRAYQKHKPEHTFEVMSGAELDSITTAKRSNCILDGRKMQEAGFEMTPSKVALERTMKRYFEESK